MIYLKFRQSGLTVMPTQKVRLLSVLLGFCLANAGCSSNPVDHSISKEAAIEIATAKLKPELGWEYEATATRIGREWLVLFNSKSEYVGDFVYVHVSLDGKDVRIEGGY